MSVCVCESQHCEVKKNRSAKKAPCSLKKDCSDVTSSPEWESNKLSLHFCCIATYIGRLCEGFQMVTTGETERTLPCQPYKLSRSFWVGGTISSPKTCHINGVIRIFMAMFDVLMWTSSWSSSHIPPVIIHRWIYLIDHPATGISTFIGTPKLLYHTIPKSNHLKSVNCNWRIREAVLQKCDVVWYTDWCFLCPWQKICISRRNIPNEFRSPKQLRSRITVAARPWKV